MNDPRKLDVRQVKLRRNPTQAVAALADHLSKVHGNLMPEKKSPCNENIFTAGFFCATTLPTTHRHRGERRTGMPRINWKQVEREEAEIENDDLLDDMQKQRMVRDLYREAEDQYREQQDRERDEEFGR